MNESHRVRRRPPGKGSGTPWLTELAAPFLRLLPRLASGCPIPIVALVIILTGSAYTSLLKHSLFGVARDLDTGETTQWSSLAHGSNRLRTGPETAWTWRRDDLGRQTVADHSALLTLVFPGHMSVDDLEFSEIEKTNFSVTPLPSTSGLWSTDTTLSLAIPHHQAPEFLEAVKTINYKEANGEKTELGSQQVWTVAGSRAKASAVTRISLTGIVAWTSDAWFGLLDLLDNTETLDIVIMALGYILMHMTFISLFLSMRRLGSNFCLATSVMVSSSCAFIFGLFVSIKIVHIPITMRLLSEGLPFLVVAIGFEKNILFTQSAKSHVAHKASGKDQDAVQYAVEAAMRGVGFRILKGYAIEIGTLVAVACSGVADDMRAFCFLAAWILCFDCVLLFAFYTPVLCITLAMNRMKRNIDIREALREGGIGLPAAAIAANSQEPETTILGQLNGAGGISPLKILMVSGIAFVNGASLSFTSALSDGSSPSSSLSKWPSSFGRSSTASCAGTFKFASAGLNSLVNVARTNGRPLVVTVLAPIKYELERIPVNYSSSQPSLGSDFDPQTDIAVGLLKSFDDPLLRKVIIAVLCLSVVFNGYLFNVARCSIDQPEPLTKVDPPTRPEQKFLRTEQQMARMLRDNLAYKLTDEEIVSLSFQGKIPAYALEKALGFDFTRAVKIRRTIVSQTKVSGGHVHLLERSMLPYQHYEWDQVFGACCESVIGYMPLPVGVAGPLLVDGQEYFVPMATTEGVLVASTSRGAKAIKAGGGAVTVLTSDGMTRGPCVGFGRLERAGAAKSWLDSKRGQEIMKTAFDSTSGYARLQSIKSVLAGTLLFIRFKATTGDAMGMNMISKGVEHALRIMKETGFADMDIVTLSGNYCSDKKPSAINWIEGRGKSVVAEATIPADVIKEVLRTSVDSLVNVFINKNMIGSAMAGSIGGFNAQAANIVAAVFLATGQDPAQVVESANCITIMKNVGGNLHITVSMPSIEVGTLGGGTILDAQGAMLDLLGVRGPHSTHPGANAQQLARIIAAATMAGELSLSAALAEGHLVRAHMQHNRSAAPTRPNTPAAGQGVWAKVRGWVS